MSPFDTNHSRLARGRIKGGLVFCCSVASKCKTIQAINTKLILLIKGWAAEPVRPCWSEKKLLFLPGCDGGPGAAARELDGAGAQVRDHHFRCRFRLERVTSGFRLLRDTAWSLLTPESKSCSMSLTFSSCLLRFHSRHHCWMYSLRIQHRTSRSGWKMSCPDMKCCFCSCFSIVS